MIILPFEVKNTVRSNHHHILFDALIRPLRFASCSSFITAFLLPIHTFNFRSILSLGLLHLLHTYTTQSQTLPNNTPPA
jgi:hypothetical protein